MTAAVHQFVPSLSPRDAIGAHTLATQELLLEMGLRSEIFADEVRPGFEGRARPYRSYGKPRRGAVLLYQASIGSPVADFLAARPEPKWVYFHNITPRRMVERWSPQLGMASATGWSQLAALAPVTAACFAASPYNRDELVRVGFAGPVVVPPLVKLTAPDFEVDPAAMEQLGSTRRGAELLFVGRVSPHKGQHHLIKALAAYRKAYDPQARLHLVGGSAGDAYRDALVGYAAALGLGEAVTMPGSVPPGELAAHYRNADAFVCASEHEGFCVPLLEAMNHRLPIVAHAAAAVPHTVGGAGLVLDSPAPLVMAAAIHRALSDPQLRFTMGEAAKARLDCLGLSRSRQAMAAAVDAALSSQR
ncbi:MAG: glycosyltransferase family 4 protein [Acidimicrobiales bacterium]